MIKYRVLKQYLKLSKEELEIIRFISHGAAKAYNLGIENIKNHYEKEKTYIGNYDNFDELRHDEISKEINAEIFQRAVFKANASFDSFYKLLKYKKDNNSEQNVKAPDETKNKYYPFSFCYIGNKMYKGKRVFRIPMAVQFKRLLRTIGNDPEELRNIGIYAKSIDIDDKSFLRFSIPRILYTKKIQEVSFIPLKGGRKFQIAYTYRDDNTYERAKGNEVLSIDVGVNNLATCITTSGKSFIVDGKRLKSMNQYYNKRMSYLKSVNPYVLRYSEEDKKWHKDFRSNLNQNEKYKSLPTKRMVRMWFKRDNKIQDYIYKASRFIIDYALKNNISTIVYGYSEGFQSKGFDYSEAYNQKSNYGKHIEKIILKKNNQKFLSIPFGKFKGRIRYLCSLHGIEFKVQEESYTSKASFIDGDDIPVYKENDTGIYHFSGERVKRGLYVTKNKTKLNADINGALNILRKSSVCGDDVISSLRRRGVNTPVRLRVI